MNYKRLTNEELQKYKYPNLKAEIIESGYGMHTISDFIGLGNTYDTQELIEAKLIGEDVITFDEAIGLTRLFKGEIAYLMSQELTVEAGKPMAYWRWLDENNRKREKLETLKERSAIERELREKPYLLDFIKVCIDLPEDMTEQAVQLLNEMKAKKNVAK